MAFRAKEVDGKKGMDEEIFGVFSFDCLIEGMECLFDSLCFGNLLSSLLVD